MSKTFSYEYVVTDATHWIDNKWETRDNEFYRISGDDDSVYNSSDDEPHGSGKNDDDNEHLDNEEESV